MSLSRTVQSSTPALSKMEKSAVGSYAGGGFRRFALTMKVPAPFEPSSAALSNVFDQRTAPLAASMRKMRLVVDIVVHSANAIVPSPTSTTTPDRVS